MVKTALSYLRLDHRIAKVREQEKAAFAPLMEAYLQSDDYASLQETLKKADDEDEYKNDTDPAGFFGYSKLVSAFRRLTLLACSSTTNST